MTFFQIFHFVMSETVQCISGFEHSCSTGNLHRNKMSLTMWPSRMRQNVTLRVTLNVSFCSYVKMSHWQVTFCRFRCDIFKCDKRTHKRYHHMCLFVTCTKGHIKGHITFTSACVWYVGVRTIVIWHCGVTAVLRAPGPGPAGVACACLGYT